MKENNGKVILSKPQYWKKIMMQSLMTKQLLLKSFQVVWIDMDKEKKLAFRRTSNISALFGISVKK